MLNMVIGKKLIQLKQLMFLSILLWVVYAIGFLIPLESFGIIPRELAGLKGIIFAPFIHGDISHLVANSIGLIMLGFILATVEENGILPVLLTVMILGGFGTWIIGRSGTVHIGASGVIYGILGYLIAIGFFRKDVFSIIVSLIVFFMYGGMIFGVLPSAPHMSWESHLCGFVSGIIAASTPAERKKKR